MRPLGIDRGLRAIGAAPAGYSAQYLLGFVLGAIFLLIHIRP
jgi:hypothetical protein